MKIVEDSTPSTIIQPNFNFKNLASKLRNAKTEKEQLQLLQGMHERLWHAPVHETQMMLHVLGLPIEIIRLALKIPKSCPHCNKYRLPKHKPLIKSSLTLRFNQVH